MQIKHEIFLIESQLQGISPMLEGILFHGEVISKVVALLSAEAKFCGMAKGLCGLLWLRRLLIEISFALNCEMHLFYDKKVAINISHNPINITEQNM